MDLPRWWSADAKHWSGRTTALTAILAFLAGSVFTFIGLHKSDAPVTTQGGATLQPTSPIDSNNLCANDSEKRVAAGWGPDRPTYHDDTYPTALTFNSTSDNINLGDERNFVGVKSANDDIQPATWSDSLEVTNGQEYLVRIYVRLDGPTTHTAKGTKLMVNLPACTGHRVGVEAFVSSNDAFPMEVWDGASFWSRHDFNLALVPDSGVVHSNAHPQGLPCSTTDLVTRTGIPLGSKGLDGVFFSGYQDAVYVVFRVRAQVAA